MRGRISPCGPAFSRYNPATQGRISHMKSLVNLVAVLCTLVAVSAFAAEDKKKDAPKPINKNSPVEGGNGSPSPAIDYKVKTIGFCCAGGDDEFKKDPAKYMAIIDKELKADKEKDKKDGAKKEDKEP